jgi:hypothetical protein
VNERRYTVFLGDGKYFFSTDHCQALREGQSIDRDVWTPCTFYLPTYVVPRPGFEDGMLRTLADWIRLFQPNDEEISNPDPRFIPDYRR